MIILSLLLLHILHLISSQSLSINHIFQIVHYSFDEANSIHSFSIFSRPNHDNIYSYESIVSHAFVCNDNNDLIGDWNESYIDIYFPCQHNTIINETELSYVLTTYNNSVVSSECSSIPGIPIHYTAIHIRLNDHISLTGPSHNMRLFPYSRDKLNGDIIDYPIIRFSYTRKTDDCQTVCNKGTNEEYTVLSTPKCKSIEEIDDKTLLLCDFERKDCIWNMNRPYGDGWNITQQLFVKTDKFLRMESGYNESMIYTSPFFSHTSIGCDFSLEALVMGEGISVFYSSLKGNINEKIILRITPSENKLGFHKYQMHIGHFSTPMRISIECKAKSICQIDNLMMIGCNEEMKIMDICSDDTMFLCNSEYRLKCISRDRICDIVEDCENGEDEDICDDLSPSSMCSFNNETSNEFCPGWSLIEESPYMNLVNGGKFMQLVQNEIERKSILSSTIYQSPILPPTSVKVFRSDSDLYQTCVLRFWYCSYGYEYTSFEWILQGQGSIPLWSLSNQQTNHTFHNNECIWNRALLTMPEHTQPYSILFSVITHQREIGLFRISNISISSSCYLNDSYSSPFPLIYNIWSCNITGSNPPSIQQCQKFYNETDEATQIRMEKDDGWQSWSPPIGGQYRIELCGGRGGSINNREGGYGGCIVAIVYITMKDTLDISIGQSGLCHEKTCVASSGGGATVIKMRGNKILIAGGGAGISIGVDDDIRNQGGLLVNEMSDGRLVEGIDEWRIGDGYSYAYERVKTQRHEHKMFSRISIRGGLCEDEMNRIGGGYGGGGPSCNISPGPGGGYIGGKRYGNVSSGGSSYVHDNITEYTSYIGSHNGEGYVRIHRCSLDCPSNQSCSFTQSNRGNDNHMKCICIHGLDCISDDESIDLFKVIAFLSFSIATALCIYGVLQNRRHRKDRIEFIRQIEDIELLDIERRNGEFDNAEKELKKMKIPFIPRKDIFIKRLLGKGEFGEVHLAEMMNIDGSSIEVAVKTLQLTSHPHTQIDFTFETLTLNRLSHKNIVRCIGVNTEMNPFYLILEYMGGGDLRTFVRMTRETSSVHIPTTMKDFLQISLDVASGCEYLEEFHHVHRDIAARNCLLTTRGEGRLVKLADFGMARDVYSIDYYRKEGRARMPVKWLPPESFMDGIFTNKSDVWSYGVLLWEVFSLGLMPYPGLSNFEVMENVQRGKRLPPPGNIPTHIYNLMTKTWRRDPNERPTFTHILHELELFMNDGMTPNLRIPNGKCLSNLIDMNGDESIRYPSIACSSESTPREERGSNCLFTNSSYAPSIL